MMLGLIAASMLAAAAPEEMAPVTTRGLGALRIGMPTATLRARGAVATETPETQGACHYWRMPGPVGSYGRIGLMVVGDRLVRIDIYDPAYRTWSGAGVGMLEADIRRIYGRAIQVRPHPYTGPEGHYLIYRVRGDRYGMIIETDPDSGRAEMMRVGLWEYVQWIEGCQ